MGKVTALGMDVLIELSLACGERLRVHRFSVREAISSLFAVRVLARSPDPCVDLSAIVGQPASLRIASGYRFARGCERVWSGLCRHARLVEAVDVGPAEVGLSTYEIAIVPSLWLLAQRSDYRVFQHLSIPEIVRAVLDGWDIATTWHVTADDHPRLAYKVQYGETDFDFVSRLLEEAGIGYTFADEDGERMRLVLSDALHRSASRRETRIEHVEQPSAAAERAYVTRVSIEEHVRPGAVVLRDHDFRRPAFALLGEARHGVPGVDGRLEGYRYRPGAFVIERGAEGAAPAAKHDARHGALLAARALEAERTGTRVVAFETNAIDLRPGTMFSIEGHPRPELNEGAGLLVTSLSIDGSPEAEWTLRGEAVPAETPYRPSRCTPKPKVHGVQSGVVVGPPGQEIHTDEHGRVRVQLAWDREGAFDEGSSCWLRVNQGWAGAGFGMFALPRVGQEVLVAFLDGDPDQPIVVGRVPNALNPPPVKLPDEKTQSAWRSASSPGGDGFNEILFEDRKGEELVSIQAQRDLRKVVRRDEAITVGRDRATIVRGNATATTDGKLVVLVGEDEEIVIRQVKRERVEADVHRVTEGDVRERIGGTLSLTAGGQQVRVRGDIALEAGGEIHIKAGTKLVLEAPDVTLKGAGGFVRIDGGGVRGPERHFLVGGGPAAGQGAHPAMPEEPARADAERAPRRLPLFGFPPGVLPPMPAGAGRGGGGPLTPDDVTVCGFICSCNVDWSPHSGKQRCVTMRIRAMEEASGHTSRIKAEVRYDMTKKPPEPIMSKNDPRRSTRGNPGGSRIPDVVVVKDGTKPPTRDNLEEVIEIKFPPDSLGDEQAAAYEKIAGSGVPFKELSPKRCGCPDRKQEQEQEHEVTQQDLAEAALLTLLVLVLILDDALPGGQADDAAIPPLLARILRRLAPLLRRPVPVMP